MIKNLIPCSGLKTQNIKYSFTGKIHAKIAAGDYILGLVIIDTINNKPGIQLAIKYLRKLENNWLETGTVHIDK